MVLGGCRRPQHHILEHRTRLLGIGSIQLPVRRDVVFRVTACGRCRSVRSLQEVIARLRILRKKLLLLRSHFGRLLILQPLVELAEAQLMGVE